MDPIIELLQEMRGRVPMYIGSNSIVKLAAFLRGYAHALARFDNGSPPKNLVDLQEAVEAKFPHKISKSWEDLILFHSSDEEEAMNTFWSVFDILNADKGTAASQRGNKGAA